MNRILSALTLLLATPYVASAQGRNFDTLQDAIRSIGDLIELVIPVLIGVAVLVFIYGVVKFIASAGKEDARKEGARVMIGGIIGLFVILSVFALVRVLQDTLGVDNENTVDIQDIPSIPTL